MLYTMSILHFLNVCLTRAALHMCVFCMFFLSSQYHYFLAIWGERGSFLLRHRLYNTIVMLINCCQSAITLFLFYFIVHL